MVDGGTGAPAAWPDALVAELLAVRDELAAAASLVVALVLACRALDLAGAERSALAELGSVVNERLGAVLSGLDQLIAGLATP